MSAVSRSLGAALTAAAIEEGAITAEGPAGAIRFEFTDIVALELLGGLAVVSPLVKKVGGGPARAWRVRLRMFPGLPRDN